MPEPNDPTPVVDPVTDPETPDGQRPEDLQHAADPQVQKLRKEAASYRVKAKAEAEARAKVEAELATYRKADEDRKAKDMTDAERAKADADRARAEAAQARAEVATARAEAQAARSGVHEKYLRVMTQDLLAAQAEDPNLDLTVWSAEYKKTNAELFGNKPAEPTGGGGAPPNKTGSVSERIKQLEAEYADLSSPLNMYRPGTGRMRVGLRNEIDRLKAGGQ